MATLKAASTINGASIAKKDASNFPTNLPTQLINQLKGTDGTTGSTNGSAGSVTLSGSTLVIVAP